MSRVLGISNWLPTAAGALFTNTGRLKSVDWQRLTKGPAAYVFEDMLPEKPQHALNAMLAALARCQDMVYDLADDKSNLPELQRRQRRETTEMIEYVCAFEAAAPKTVMHVPANSPIGACRQVQLPMEPCAKLLGLCKRAVILLLSITPVDQEQPR
jgi:hypothetical protein